MTNGDLNLRGHEPPTGPLLSSAPWPQVLVTMARSLDGRSLDLALHRHQHADGEPVRLGFSPAGTGRPLRPVRRRRGRRRRRRVRRGRRDPGRRGRHPPRPDPDRGCGVISMFVNCAKAWTRLVRGYPPRHRPATGHPATVPLARRPGEAGDDRHRPDRPRPSPPNGDPAARPGARPPRPGQPPLLLRPAARRCSPSCRPPVPRLTFGVATDAARAAGLSLTLPGGGFLLPRPPVVFLVTAVAGASSPWCCGGA